MNLQATDLVGYVIGLAAIVLSAFFYWRSQRKHRERLVRLLDPHVMHQDLEGCRKKITSNTRSKWFRQSNKLGAGVQELAILQQTIQNVQKYVLVVRSENYEQYDTLLAQALDQFESGNKDAGVHILDKAIVLSAAEARVLGE